MTHEFQSLSPWCWHLRQLFLGPIEVLQTLWEVNALKISASGTDIARISATGTDLVGTDFQHRSHGTDFQCLDFQWH